MALSIHAWSVAAPPWPLAPIPTFDVADYLVQAAAFAEAIEARDGRAVIELALEPSVHPPLHPLLLGAWMALTEPTAEMACAWAFVLRGVGLLLVVALGAAVRPVGGVEAGVTAALLTSLGLLHESMFLAPMTEPLAMVLVLATLVAVVYTRGKASIGSGLMVGAALLGASLVRYNLLPMLAVPLLGYHAWEARRAPRDPWTWVTPVLWLAPLGLVFGAWSAARPDLFAEVSHFFRNVDSGIPVLSVANLGWLATAFTSQVTGAPLATVLVVLAALWSLRAEATSPARLLWLFLLVGAAALLFHRYKLGRNVFVLVPVLYTVVLSGLWSRADQARSWSVAALASAILTAGVHLTTRSLAQESYFTDDRFVMHALDAVATAGRTSRRVVIAGAHRDFNEHLLTWWLNKEGVASDIDFQEPYHPSCARETPKPGVSCSPDLVETWMDTPGTVVVTVAQSGGRGSVGAAARREWTQVMWDQVEDLLEARGYHHEDVEVRSAGLRVRVYAAPLD